ncbi:MAG: hypothetical protein F6K56_00070 [Moorea sp. SIO3G5]|nr:hypothetical protein [Moorena sp. SIO3G5]
MRYPSVKRDARYEPLRERIRISIAKPNKTIANVGFSYRSTAAYLKSRVLGVKSVNHRLALAPCPLKGGAIHTKCAPQGLTENHPCGEPKSASLVCVVATYGLHAPIPCPIYHHPVSRNPYLYRTSEGLVIFLPDLLSIVTFPMI